MKSLWLLAVAVLLAACSKKEPPPEPVRPVLSVKVQALNEETLGRFAGSIQARYESNTGFRVGGRIASRNVDVGAEVEKGTLLATLDPSDQQNQLRSAQGDLAKVQAQLINAQANARRQQALFDRGVGAQAQLDIATTDLKTTQASLEQAQAAVNQSKDQLGYTELRADHKAVVTAWNAEAGQVVTAGQQVVTLAQPDIKEAVIDLPDTLVDQIPSDVVFLVAAQLDPSINTTAVIREIEPQAQSATRTRRARLTLAETPRFSPRHRDQCDPEFSDQTAYRIARNRAARSRWQNADLGDRHSEQNRQPPRRQSRQPHRQHGGAGRRREKRRARGQRRRQQPQTRTIRET